ncbi:MAG: glycosyl hydrolase [Phycisphaerales bacterium]
MRHVLSSVVLFLNAAAIAQEAQPAPVAAEVPPVAEKPAETKMSKIDGGTFGCLSARLLGPAILSGRIGDLAINPENHSEWYVAVASGGLWKTTNAGHTFTPIFDGYGSYSIGCVTLDSSNANTVWVGTGENNSQRSVAWGDGVYVSRNGGKSFENTGLKDSGNIGMIAVHPDDSDVVFVAAMGPLWRTGGDRGLYKTIDGGKTWERALHVGEDTGISEVRFDPRDPSVMYATAYQRRRHVWTLVNGGPESGVFKSTDGGANWRRIDSGLPGGDKGRPGIVISPANPEVLYCIVNATDGGGIYRSRDRGETWEFRSSYMTTSPQYYNELFCDPEDVDRVYSMDTYLHMSEDGGATWRSIESGDKHVDNHALWIDPNDPKHLIVGSDGGIYETFDRGAGWRHFENLPIMQFYRVAADNDAPFYNVYGGTQDNNTIGGPSQNTDVVGVGNEHWFVVTGGDGFEPAIDPENPNIVYGQSQHGVLVRMDKVSGESVSVQPQPSPGEAPYVWNWDSPLVISPHNPARLYFGADRVLRSDDRGDSWRPISPDLTRGVDRNTLEVMGKIQKPEAVDKHKSTSIYGNLISLTESPLIEGLLFAGADDGRITVTEDGGATWRDAGKIEGMPELIYVSDIVASHHNPDVVYVTYNNHKNGDFTPYVFKSVDRARTFTRISGDLPERNACHTLVEDHKSPNLLFVGTEFGAYYTLDGGAKWIKIAGLPVISVRDLDVQKREDDLVIGTFGRGIYIVHDYSPLRFVNEETLNKRAAFFPIKPAKSFIKRSRLGWGGRGFAGVTYWSAQNPPYGAVFTLSINEKTQTLREARMERQNQDGWKYPTMEEFRAESFEQAPEMFLTIRDAAGEVVRRIGAPRGIGIHRVVWDLSRVSLNYTDGSLGGGGGSQVPPGTYTVTLSLLKDAKIEDLTAPESFEVRALNLNPRAANEEQVAAKEVFRKRVEELQRELTKATNVLAQLEERNGKMRRAITQTPGANIAMLERCEQLRGRLRSVRHAVSGDPEFDKRFEPEAPSLWSRVWIALNGARESSEPVTGIAREQFDFADAAFKTIKADLESIRKDTESLAEALDAAGAPWTGG